MAGNTAERVEKLISATVAEMGYDLWDVRFLKEGASWYLRVFIDKDEGVWINDCTDVSHAIDPILDELFWDGITTVQKLRAIYDYVYDNTAYVSTSDKSGWVRAAYNGLLNRNGDCFTYFALSKAMMERAGIQNMDIQRSPEIAAMVNERHYWSLVNIGTEANPQWYHFDACHMSGTPKPWGFLMTDEQLLQFSDKRENADGISGYFYVYDSTAYPSTSTQIFTPYHP